MDVIKKFYTDIDVVSAAKQRIKNIFANKCPIVLSVSGGKDSICLNDLVFKLVERGEIDKSLLRVIFVDEEAIYPCIEKVVLDMRRRWLMVGVPFDWYAMEYKHFNCLNQLTQDESFICFDETKRDVWVRQPPSFAIRKHPKLRRGVDTYQAFLNRIAEGKVQMIGVRASESIQRLSNLARGSVETTGNAFPIYDWTDADVWKYISDNDLKFPDAYMFMYQCGVPMNKMRISQFFSVDTVGSLVKMCEFYPNLFDRICKREPNAYMTMLYFDTELFRREKKRQGKDKTDYKAKTLHYLEHPELFNGKEGAKLHKDLRRLVLKHSANFGAKEWKMAYNICVGGDPKRRSSRVLISSTYRELGKGVR